MIESEMKEEGRPITISQLCRWFGVARSSMYYKPKARSKRQEMLDPYLVKTIRHIIDENPEYGLRRITAVLKKRMMKQINRKRVHKILKANGWQMHKKPTGKRPRAFGLRSQASKPNERWAIDTTHIFCGRDGWCHLTAIIDCCDRHIVGWRLSRSGIAKVAAAALEDAIRERNPSVSEHCLMLRSDNGLVFGSKDFVRVVRAHRLNQEYITPYTPEQNGMIERFFKTLKEECVWHYNFKNKDEAFWAIANFMDKYHKERPHSALGYKTPAEFREVLAA